MSASIDSSRLHTLHNFRVVLCQTSHPGNIGSAARAMKTMGLQHLYLVNPHSFPDAHATALSTGAADLHRTTQARLAINQLKYARY